MKSNIKTTAKFFLTALMFTSFTSFAAEANKEKEDRRAEAEISNTIRNQISFPDFLLTQREDEFYAEVAFKVSETGQVIVTEVKAENDSLVENVKRQLSNIRFDQMNVNGNDTYRVVLRFRAL